MTKFPDGSIPQVVDIVRIACFLFAAGQETTARLLATAFRQIAERPEVQQLLRENPDRIADFLEETLRIESPVKSDFRLARFDTKIGDIEVRAGSTVMLLLGAANRDPSHFDNPNEFRIDRPNARQHISFARGAHTCPGGLLARVEARITIERFLKHMSDIRISESEHGPAHARRFAYEPTFLLRGLKALHLEFTPSGPSPA